MRVLSTSTSETGARHGGRRAGAGRRDAFTLVEVLVGLALGAVVVTAAMPVWLGLQNSGVRAADRTIHLVQQRVAIARFEHDLRLASAWGCPFAVSGPILAATSAQVVLLVGGPDGSPPVLVEWEFANGALMRRTGPCPPAWPTVFRHSLYSDHKTMLDHLGGGSAFEYMVRLKRVDGPVDTVGLGDIEAVVVALDATDEGAPAAVRVTAMARVGR